MYPLEKSKLTARGKEEKKGRRETLKVGGGGRVALWKYGRRGIRLSRTKKKKLLTLWLNHKQVRICGKGETTGGRGGTGNDP